MECSEGTLLGGRVRYRQPVVGFRTGIEPVLLAAAVPAKPGQLVLEAGTGAGAGLLCLGARVPGLGGLGIERDPGMATLARRNLADNAIPFDILEADINALPPPLTRARFDHVFANPPWHDPASTRPAESRTDSAKHRHAGGLAAWVAALAGLVAARGTVSLILPATLLGEAVTLLHAAGFGRLTLAPFWPRAGQAAKIVLVQAVRGKPASRIGPGLVLHGAGPGYTPVAEAILRDGAALTLS